jgi:hypothetical protein
MKIVRDALTPLRLSPGTLPAYESADRKLCTALTAYGDQRAREARAAAIEAAAQAIADEMDISAQISMPALTCALRRIRALAAAPPQSEERHLTPSEHKVMNRALLRSMRPVDPPRSDWRDIASAPTDTTQGDFLITLFNRGNYCWVQIVRNPTNHHGMSIASHWMPLPDPPQSEGGEGYGR